MCGWMCVCGGRGVFVASSFCLSESEAEYPTDNGVRLYFES